MPLSYICKKKEHSTYLRYFCWCKLLQSDHRKINKD